MNFPNVAADIAQAQQEAPELGRGVHLTLTAGRPLTPPEQIPTLVGADEGFFSLRDFLARLDMVDPAQVKAEWRQQIEKFIQLTGRKPTHLDSHHHSAYYTEPFFRGMLELAAEYGCAVRQITTQNDGLLRGLPGKVRQDIIEFAPRLMLEFNVQTTDVFCATFFDELATKAEFLNILNRLSEDGLYEIMCHPGYSNAALEATSSYHRQRESELTVLTDKAIQTIIRERNLKLTTFARLQGPSST